jgi:hypothetical protein
MTVISKLELIPRQHLPRFRFIRTITTTIAAVEQVKLKQQVCNLGDGEVELPDPLAIAGLQLQHPRLLGSGGCGGGAVFSVEYASKSNQNAPSFKQSAIKVSWRRSAVSVENECHILRLLQDSSVSGEVETCRG